MLISNQTHFVNWENIDTHLAKAMEDLKKAQDHFRKLARADAFESRDFDLARSFAEEAKNRVDYVAGLHLPAEKK